MSCQGDRTTSSGATVAPEPSLTKAAAVDNRSVSVAPTNASVAVGAAAGDPTKGYGSYDLGDRHLIVLNSNSNFVACAAGSPQEEWLRADLAATTKACVVA